MSPYDQNEDHGCRYAGLGIRAIGKDFTMRNRGAESIMSPYNQNNLSVIHEYKNRTYLLI